MTKDINFYDYSQGLNFLEEINDNYFYGVIQFKLFGVKNYSIIEFILKIFDVDDTIFKIVQKEQISYFATVSGMNCGDDFIIKIYTKNLKTKAQMQEYLDLIVLANTYSEFFVQEHYFAKMGYNYSIIHSKYLLCYEQIGKIIIKLSKDIFSYKSICEIVWKNTNAHNEKLEMISIPYEFKTKKFYEYDFKLTKLTKSLLKKID